MANARDYIPAFFHGHQVYPQNMILPNMPLEGGKVWFVDGDKSTGGAGATWEDAFVTLVAAEAAASAGDVIFVAAKTMAKTDTDPGSYTENLTIDTPQLSIIGVSRGRTQGGLPQIKVGSTTTQAIIRVRAPGVLIMNLGINGVSATGGGIRFDDNGGTTYASFGGSVIGCHFKNCKGTTATNAATGGAIQLSGAPWQMYFGGNRFYKNVGDIAILDTSTSAPQDIVIEDNAFSGPATSVDCNIYTGGSGVASGLVIRNNTFEGLPNITSGTNKQFLMLTGSTGILADNTFAASTAEGGSEETFGATANNLVPTTVFMARNFGEFSTGVGAGLVSGEIFRT